MFFASLLRNTTKIDMWFTPCPIFVEYQKLRFDLTWLYTEVTLRLYLFVEKIFKTFKKVSKVTETHYKYNGRWKLVLFIFTSVISLVVKWFIRHSDFHWIFTIVTRAYGSRCSRMDQVKFLLIKFSNFQTSTNFAWSILEYLDPHIVWNT